MKLQRTKQGKITSKLPTDLDIKRIELARSPHPSAADEKEIHRLQAGETGEQKIVDFFQKYGSTHWIGIQNIWLNHFGTSEIDFTLVTNYCQYLIEIKNYNGVYVYKDGISTVNNHVISSNPIDQTRRAVTKMQDIMSEYSHNIPVKGVLIFAGENSQVSIQSEVNDIEILKTEDLYHFIQKIIREEQAYKHNPINPQLVINHMEKYEVPSPYPVTPITKDKFEKLRRGIYCAYCGNFNLNIEKHYVKCECGLHEPREIAIIRTICEYGTLNFKSHLYTGKLTEFLNGQASHVYIQ